MLTDRHWLTKIFFYSSIFFFVIFIILLLKFIQINHDIDNNRIHHNSIFYGLPSLKLLNDYTPKQLSQIISADGKILYEFYDFDSNREIVEFNKVPKHVIDALIASEDKNFYNHYGIHINSILRSFYKNIIGGRTIQGGSTITMQLARNLYDMRDRIKKIGHKKKMSRKIQEIILAIKIEQAYTKEKILEMYLNSIYFGNIKSRAMWGIQKASNIIFAKDIEEINLAEGSLLIGLLPGPNTRLPFRHPEKALKTRNKVLDNMFEMDFIDKFEYMMAIEEALPINPHLDRRSNPPYYVQFIEKELSILSDIDYKSGGLIIYTTIDSRIQEILDTAFINILTADNSSGIQYRFNKSILDNELGYNERLDDICSSMEDDRVGTYKSDDYLEINREIYSISYQIDSLVKHGYSKDSKLVKSFVEDFENLSIERKVFEENLNKLCYEEVRNILIENIIPQELRSQLLVQGAAVIFDVKTGSVLGMIGGRQEEEYRDYFNRAILSNRQPGSVFKPFLYLTALKNGYNPATTLLNQSSEIVDWAPENWNQETGGEYSLRQGLYGSINLIAVSIIDSLVQPYTVRDNAYNFGISTHIKAVPSIALGSSEVKPIEITSAYSTIANGGIYVKPMIIKKIRDDKGRLIKEFIPHSLVVESPATSYVLLDMMQDVVNQYKFNYRDVNRNGKFDKEFDQPIDRGTGHQLRTKHNFGFMYNDLDQNGKFSLYSNSPEGWREVNSSKITIACAGKTGTTNLQTDAWFVGFTPQISMGVWIGMDDKRIRLGEKSFGSSTALPIFAESMKGIYELGNYFLDERLIKLDSTLDWSRIPDGVSEVLICIDSKLIANPKICNHTYKELIVDEFTPKTCYHNINNRPN